MIKCNYLLTNCIFVIFIAVFCTSCIYGENNSKQQEISITDSAISIDSSGSRKDYLSPDTIKSVDESIQFDHSANRIDVKNVQPEQLVSFAKTLIGIPYKYASTDPEQGFDCSGFISYVFNHFNIAVPRSSVDFTNIPTEIKEYEAKEADIILFTGTDSTIKIVGHMGIVIENHSSGIQFIHSSSGKANGVTVSPLEGYYRGRFVKLIRIF